jgi:hypothetical protein
VCAHYTRCSVCEQEYEIKGEFEGFSKMNVCREQMATPKTTRRMSVHNSCVKRNKRDVN